VPFAEDVQAIRNVAHRVIREHGIESGRLEWKWLARVHGLERHSACDALRHGQLLRIANAMLVDIDAGDAAATCDSEVDGWTTGAASDFQNVSLFVHLRQIGKSKPLRSGHPTALANVLTKGATAHLGLGSAIEVCVNVVVKINGLGHRSPHVHCPMIGDDTPS
jgi:hypothetical protein